jgi:hypothetical protein
MTRRKPKGTASEEPVRTDAMRIIAEKRGELAEAERAIAEARGAYDADGLVMAQQRASALRQIISDLEARHAAELEDVQLQRARRWMEGRPLRAIAREVEGAQQEAMRLLDLTIPAIEREGAARRQLAEVEAGIELLKARWPELAAGPSARGVTSVPGSFDYAGRVGIAAKDVRDGLRRPVFVVGAPASATEEQRRTLVLRALYAAISRGRGPEDVRAIIEAAPVPTEAAETPEERQRRERREGQREREGAKMGVAVAETEWALRGISGSVGSTSG